MTPASRRAFLFATMSFAFAGIASAGQPVLDQTTDKVQADDTSEDHLTRNIPDDSIAAALGFWHGHLKTLERIAAEFPALRAQARARVADTSLKISAALDGMESALHRRGHEPQKLYSILDRMLAEQAGDPLEAEEAKQFLSDAKARNQGELSIEIGSVSLAFHPSYQSHPDRELASGWTRTATVAASRTTKGLSLQLSIPTSWVEKRPHTPSVCFFARSHAGFGPILLSVTVVHDPSLTGLTMDELELLGTDLLPSDDWQLKSTEVAQVGLRQGLRLTARGKTQIGDQTLHQWMQTTCSIHDDRIVMVQCFVQLRDQEIPLGQESAPFVDALAEKYQPLLKKIDATLLVTPPSQALPSPPHGDGR